jgi:hypothetical protein
MNTNTKSSHTASGSQGQLPASPWSEPPRAAFHDEILKTEFEERRLQLPIGETWMRIVPAQEGSAHSWLLPVRALSYTGGRFAHPKTLRPNAKSAYDNAYSWLSKNRPELLFSKTNKSAARLLTDPIALFWVVVDLGGGPVLRLFQASGYDGSRGGVPGLGFQIWRMTRQLEDPDGSYTDAVDPEIGVQICVEKIQPSGAKYPTYRVRRGLNPAPVDPIIERLAAEERAALVPLENVVRELTDEEQWERLGRTLPRAVVAEIRTSLGR